MSAGLNERSWTADWPISLAPTTTMPGPRSGIVVAEFYVGPLTLPRQMKAPSLPARDVHAMYRRECACCDREKGDHNATPPERAITEDSRSRTPRRTANYVSRQRGYVTLKIRRGNERRGHAITASYAYLMTRFYGSKGRAQRATLPVGGGLALLYA